MEEQTLPNLSRKPGSKKPYPYEIKASVHAVLFSRNKTHKQISKEFNIPRSTITGWARGEVSKKPYIYHPLQTRKEFFDYIHEHRGPDETLDNITRRAAAAFGFNLTLVKRWIRKEKLKNPNLVGLQGEQRTRPTLSKKAKQEMIDSVRSGITQVEVAKIFNVATSTVHRVITGNISIRNYNKYKEEEKREVQLYIYQHLLPGETMNQLSSDILFEISNKFKIKLPTLRFWINKWKGDEILSYINNHRLPDETLGQVLHKTLALVIKKFGINLIKLKKWIKEWEKEELKNPKPQTESTSIKKQMMRRFFNSPSAVNSATTDVAVKRHSH